MNRFAKITLGALTGLTLLGATAAIASPGECDSRDFGRHAMMGGGMMGHHGPRVDFAKLTPEQVRTLSEAHLIMSGDQNLKVGNVQKTDTGYTVTIVDSAGKTVRTTELPPQPRKN